MRRRFSPLLLLAALLPGPRPLAAQGVLIAPTTVLIDSRVRTASVLLVNPGDRPAEVDLSMLFGLPVTDSLGQLTLREYERPDSTLRSAVSWIRAFPRRMTIAPRGQQTVRLLVTPPPGLADGEYWARLVVTSRAGQVPVTVAGAESPEVKVGLDLQIRAILPVLYRKGKVTTGIRLSGVRAAVHRDTLEVRADLAPEGNAAALGTLRGELVDTAGVVRAAFEYPAVAYVPVSPRIVQPLDAALPPGRYLLRLEITPTRDDLEPGTLLPFTAVRDSVTLQVPGP